MFEQHYPGSLAHEIQMLNLALLRLNVLITGPARRVLRSMFE